VAVFIHWGGWLGGKKEDVVGAHASVDLKAMLEAGISVVSVEHRLIRADAENPLPQPPVQAPMEDAKRGLQFIRSKAALWNLDAQRVAACGGGSGATMALWLALKPDMADLSHADPLFRHSTRVCCVAVLNAQTTLDPKLMQEWVPNINYGAVAFGFGTGEKSKRDADFAQFLKQRETVLPWIKEYSPWDHVSADDPPVYLSYETAPVLGQAMPDPTPSANHGVKFHERLQAAGVQSEFYYPGVPDAKHRTFTAYVIEKLGRSPATLKAAESGGRK
jgi:acetyl esterase/lipase